MRYFSAIIGWVRVLFAIILFLFVFCPFFDGSLFFSSLSKKILEQLDTKVLFDFDGECDSVIEGRVVDEVD